MKSKEHEHDFIYRPEFLGISCTCGRVRFETKYGTAEYRPDTNQVVYLSDNKLEVGDE